MTMSFPLTRVQRLRKEAANAAHVALPWQELSAYVTITEAAEFLGVSPNTIRNCGRSGQIPEYRHAVNNYRLFKASDLDQLLGETEQAINSTNTERLPRQPW